MQRGDKSNPEQSQKREDDQVSAVLAADDQVSAESDGAEHESQTVKHATQMEREAARARQPMRSVLDNEGAVANGVTARAT